jgi:hypothetical protein
MKKEPTDGRDEAEGDAGHQVVYRVVDGRLVRVEGAVDDGCGDWSGHTETVDPDYYPRDRPNGRGRSR